MSPPPAVISVFNNKGGVGKTTLTFHLGHALAELGHKTLFVDLDPQCNITIYNLDMGEIEGLWRDEDSFIDDGFESTKIKLTAVEFENVLSEPRSVHFLLKPTEEGTGEIDKLPPPFRVGENLDIIPGRITLHTYEEKISSRWSDVYRGEPLAIRTVTRIRTLIESYAEHYGYEYVLLDTSPSLGALNKVAINTVDAFLIPCLPDVFSLYGVRNIGRALSDWNAQFKIIHTVLSPEKRKAFPQHSVGFLGFTIFNARKYTGTSPWDLALAHYNYAREIPSTITKYIPDSVRIGIDPTELEEPIGGKAVMHSHGTLPAMANKYRVPIWRVPDESLEPGDRGTVSGNRQRYEATQSGYHAFAKSVVQRIKKLKTSGGDV
ncbi:ParA family protein [Enhygromyxa salina]|uniref:Chromosome partitioning protein ParA n=1 Tax=Enhygromyxa salina TaxID=215803 RepID=A0A2S9YUN1_9BACT|nr:ParA family protein [Enhygromyxa salina]PRQ08793.1 Chromosome partitioning protein ParA [Enhygromyxa salina]